MFMKDQPYVTDEEAFNRIDVYMAAFVDSAVVIVSVFKFCFESKYDTITHFSKFKIIAVDFGMPIYNTITGKRKLFRLFLSDCTK